jgi:DNA polymerase-3 subunit delta'
MTFKDLIGQDAVVTALQRAVRSNRIAHAYLFVGPEAVGKRATAFALAKALNCRRPDDGDACDTCESCHKIELGVHPDVRFIGPTLEDSRGYLTPVPDDAPGGAVIRMSQIRVIPNKPRQVPGPLVHDIALRPTFSPWKVYIISPADRMQTETPNALLHVLEEPPPYAVLILVTARPAAILPTVHSRCREVRFRLAPAGDIAGLLKKQGVEAAQAERLARLASGRAGWAIRASQHAEMLQAREALVEWIESLCQAPPEAVLRLAEDLRSLTYNTWRGEPAEASVEEAAGDVPDDAIEDQPQPAEPAASRLRLSEDQVLRSRLPESLEVVLTWLRDLAAVRAGRADLAINADHAAHLSQAADRPLDDLRRAMSAVQRAIRYIERRASIPITTDALVEALVSSLGRPEKT